MTHTFLIALATLGLLAGTGPSHAAPPAATASTPRPALTVSTAQPLRESLARRLPANGSVAAWQEASIGSESNGLRLAEVRVNVGE